MEFHYVMWMVGEAIFKNPPDPVQGWTTLTERAGHGLEPNEDVLRDTEEK